MNTPFEEEVTEVDFCVVGGGLSGMLAAIAAARHGAKVALMQDRPVLGGNASSEIRMWVGGAHGRDMRETGIIEELMLDNHFYNPGRNPSVWDSILYGAVRYQPGVKLILNCSCNKAEMDGRRIVSVTGWQTTTQKWQTVKARLFADCSGDSVLAPLSGADWPMGREARAEFGEDIEPEAADNHTMGLSCLVQARETTEPQPFVPPPWANKYETDADITRVFKNFRAGGNWWWLELGGMQNALADTEEIRDELLKVVFGLWDHYKNKGDHGAANWKLDWVGSLPGKRETRRYLGDRIMTQNDIRAEGRFDDVVAYGGWSMDDHNPKGFGTREPPTIFHPAPSPYGISYRSLYSRNVENLFCAGRNISVSHAALSSTRVMATCAIIGQAVGTAASIAVREQTTPRGVAEKYVRELQQTLLDDDCYIPWLRRDIPALSKAARLSASDGDPSALLNGTDRPVGDAVNGAEIPLGGWVEYAFAKPEKVGEARIVFDSDLNRTGEHGHHYNLMHEFAFEIKPLAMPATLVRAFSIYVRDDSAEGGWRKVAHVDDNRRRMVKVAVGAETMAVRLVPESLWGEGAACRMFAFDVR